VFVKEIIPETNVVVLGDLEDLKESAIMVRDFNLIKYESLPQDYTALTKIRYKDAGRLSTINHEDNKLSILFHESATGIAPGQSAVIYEGDDLVGGGFIDRKPILFS
jgi:tRNA-uridine 2-sulfurtransferase